MKSSGLLKNIFSWLNITAHPLPPWISNNSLFSQSHVIPVDEPTKIHYPHFPRYLMTVSLAKVVQ